MQCNRELYTGYAGSRRRTWAVSARSNRRPSTQVDPGSSTPRPPRGRGQGYWGSRHSARGNRVASWIYLRQGDSRPVGHAGLVAEGEYSLSVTAMVTVWSSSAGAPPVAIAPSPTSPRHARSTAAPAAGPHVTRYAHIRRPGLRRQPERFRSVESHGDRLPMDGYVC